jgi:hypothetical protein
MTTRLSRSWVLIMQRSVMVASAALCLLIAAVLLIGLYAPNVIALIYIPTAIRTDVFLHFGAIGMRLVCAGIALWALVRFWKSRGRLRRAVFLSVVVTAVLMFGADVLAWMQPSLATLLRGPFERTLAWVFGICLALAFIIDSRR